MAIKRVNNNKIVIVTTPIRPIPTEYPPIGSLGIVKALRSAGYSNTSFYDIDGLRPTYEVALEYLVAGKPDVVGISAVVSTAYEYTKKISLDIKKKLPKTKIILGETLVSAEILLKLTGVDFIAIGEGEQVIVDFMNCLNSNGDLSSVKNLAFLNNKNELINTGYGKPLGNDEIYDVDWDILKKYSKIGNFFVPVTNSVLADSSFLCSKKATQKAS